jgi:ubiquinone/menaquinone biosynthesis C-methylase UbiE
MNEQQHQIREQQRESWNEFSGGWKKWDDVTMEFLRPAGDAIIQRLHLSEGSVVLDLAAGTGEPALTIAERIPQGTVHVTDLSDKMLDIARENATARGITNVVFSVCDASEMPFEDAMFDAVSCRFGLMFVPDLQGLSSTNLCMGRARRQSLGGSHHGLGATYPATRTTAP